MYEQTFNFSQRPFNLCPTPEEFFPGQSHQQAVDASRSCIERRNGPVVLVGAIGTGKSLTMQVVGEIYADQFDVVSIECSQLEQRSELLQSILFGLGLPFRDMGEGELRLSLIDHLKNGRGSKEGMLLLVDEADRLSVELLDELRLITNVVRDGRTQVQLMLAGTQRLEESLNDPRLASFNQRVASRSYLQNLSHAEVEDYIADHVARVGGNVSEVFSKCAIAEIARCTDGCPRLVNQVCERALSDAAAQSLASINEAMVQQAWAELQNLPLPSRSQTESETDSRDRCNEDSGSVVEFGSLDDDQDSSSFHSVADTSANDSFGSYFTEGSGQTQTADPFNPPMPTGAVDSPEADDSIEAVEPTETIEPTETVEPTEAIDHIDGNNRREEDGAPETANSFDLAQPKIEEPSKAESLEVDQAEEESSSESWGGRLPTNLGVADFRTEFDSHSPGISAPPMGGSGDPFAPDSTDSGIGRMAYQQSQDNERSPGSVAFSFGNDYADHPAQGQFDSSEQNNAHIESLQQEQKDLLEQVDAATGPVFHGGRSEPIFGNLPLESNPENDVKAAFEGLEQIDQARPAVPESQTQVPQTPAERSVEAAVDPFDEDFEEEVLLQDTYSPFVAMQNQSSLSVTSENLAHLRPSDEEGSAGNPSSIGSGVTPSEEASSTVNASTEFTFPTAPADATFVPVQSVPTELAVSAAAEAREPDPNVEPEIDPDLAALTSDFTFEEESNPATGTPWLQPPQNNNAIYPNSVDEAGDTIQPANLSPFSLSVEEEAGFASAQPFSPSSSAVGENQMKFGDDHADRVAEEIRHEAEGIVQELRSTIDSGVSHGTGYPFDQASAEDSSNVSQAPEKQQPLDPAHQVLHNLMAQQQGKENQRPQAYESAEDSTPEVDSISVEYPITEHENYQTFGEFDDDNRDDRDMLRVNESQHAQPPQQVSQPRSPLADATPSTGEAQRMDYGQLFDQLRNLPKE